MVNDHLFSTKALKVYSDPVVIKLLSQLGAGFDCASKVSILLNRCLHVPYEINPLFTSVFVTVERAIKL